MKATLFMGTSVSYSDLADKLDEVFEGGATGNFYISC